MSADASEKGELGNDSVFEVQLLCSKCGDTWTQFFRKGIRVDRINFGTQQKVVARKSRFCQEHRVLECHTCGFENTVKVDDRRPLDNEVAA